MIESKMHTSSEQRLAIAREHFEAGDWSLVIVTRDGTRYESRNRGVAPLLELVERLGKALREAVLADKVIGRAAALLTVGAGFRRVYARVLSEPARQVLETAEIPVEWGRLVAGIRNREKDGPCPMEALTMDVDDPGEALRKLRRVLNRD